jgi:hypothetical protein
MHPCLSLRYRDICNVILQLKALGISNVLRFPYLSPPPAQTMVNALEVSSSRFVMLYLGLS